MIESKINPMRGAALSFIEDKLAVGMSAFSMTELLSVTRLSEIAAKNQLLRLSHLVKRVTPRQGFFLIVTPEHRLFGAPPIEQWLGDYFAWLGHPYYVGLQSAAALYGSSQQAIQETQVITDVPMRTIELKRIRIHFYTKTHVIKSLIQQVPNTYAPLLASLPETTAFDLVRYANSIGGVERAAETIKAMIPLMHSQQLSQVLIAEDELATAQRLGLILKMLKADRLAQVVINWLPKHLKNVPLSLGTTIHPEMLIDKTFNIIVNNGF